VGLADRGVAGFAPLGQVLDVVRAEPVEGDVAEVQDQVGVDL
jgi:hypothetical protein